MLVPTSGEFIKASKDSLRLYRWDSTDEVYEYRTIDEDTVIPGTSTKVLSTVSGWVKDSRTGTMLIYSKQKSLGLDISVDGDWENLNTTLSNW